MYNKTKQNNMGTNLTEKRRHPDFTQTGNSRESKKQRKFADEPNVTMETPEMLQTLMAPHPQPQLHTPTRRPPLCF